MNNIFISERELLIDRKFYSEWIEDSLKHLHWDVYEEDNEIKITLNHHPNLKNPVNTYLPIKYMGLSVIVKCKVLDIYK